MNRKFCELKDSPDIQAVPDDRINEPPTKWVHELFDLFLDYYRQNESIVDDKQGNPSIEMQRQRLYAALELRDLSDRFQDDNSSSDEVQMKTTLKSYIHDLINLMMQYPHLRNCNKNFKEFWKQHEENASDSNFSERMKNRKAKISALLLIHEDIRLYQGKMEDIVPFFETILQSYRDERLYQFFLNLYQSITQYPILQTLAPVYVWRLFSRHRNPLFQGKNALFTGKKSVDFSPTPLFNELTSTLLSEESTSKRHMDADQSLFISLEDFFKPDPNEIAVDLPMCEHIWGRLLHTEMQIYSATSIIGLKLKTKKPLFRGLHLIYEPLQHMADGLWKQMPRKDNFSVTPEQAEQFYMENRKHTDKVMKHLLERSGGKPDASKKILPIDKCCEIAEVALLHSDEETPQKLHNLMQQYIKSDTILHEYAALSTENFEKVQFAVYRIALERYAHKLTRDILSLCAEIFYQPIPNGLISKMWDQWFCERSEIWASKQIEDATMIREIMIKSRITTTLYPPNGTIYPLDKIRAENELIMLSGDNPKAYQQYLSDQSHHLSVIFEPEMLDAAEDINQLISDFITMTKLAKDAGFCGIKINIGNVTVPAQHLLANNFTTMDNDALIVLADIFSPFTYLVKQIRQIVDNKFLILAKVNLYRYSPLPFDILRVLCRWLAEDGADLLELQTELLQTAADIAQNLPVPVIVPENILLPIPNTAELTIQNTAIWGINLTGIG